MLTPKHSYNSHKLLSVAAGFAATAGLFLSASLPALADDATTTAEVANSIPTLSNLVISTDPDAVSSDSTVTIGEGLSGTVVYMSGTFTDLNGCEDINVDGTFGSLVAASSTFDLVMGGSPASGFGTDEIGGLTNHGADVSGVNPIRRVLQACAPGTNQTTLTFHASTTLPYYVKPTDGGSASSTDHWMFNTQVADYSVEAYTGAFSSSPIYFDVASTAALDLNGATTLDFGSLALGANGTGTLNVRNTGNRSIDTSIYGSTFSCTYGSFAASRVHASTTLGFSYGAGDVVGVDSGSAATEYIGLVRATDASASTPPNDDLYFNLSIPSSGVGGTCTSTMSFDAVAL